MNKNRKKILSMKWDKASKMDKLSIAIRLHKSLKDAKQVYVENGGRIPLNDVMYVSMEQL